MRVLGVPQLTAPQVAKYKLIIPSFDEQNEYCS